jgi:hypothetical protein
MLQEHVQLAAHHARSLLSQFVTSFLAQAANTREGESRAEGKWL